MTDTNEFFSAPDNVVEDTPANLLEAMVGEGKKYKDLDALAKAVLHSQAHIKTIEEENAALRKQSNTTARLDEVIERLTKVSPSNEPTPERREPETPNSLTPEAVEAIIAKRESKKQEEANLKSVKDEFAKIYGQNWQTQVKQKASELGLSDEEVVELAKSRPQVLLKAFGTTQPQKQTVPAIGPNALNTSSLSSLPNTGKENWSYFEKVRKENSEVYHSKPFQDKLLRAVGRAMSGQDPDFYN